MKRYSLFLVPMLMITVLAHSAEDLLIADFEGSDDGKWKVEGDAFGKGPASGKLPGQMAVAGFEGTGLVNSFHNGDEGTGTLTSPAFKIERSYINFLIGGGKYPGRTCMILLVDGAEVRMETGPNDKPGGSETLSWKHWDVKEFIGKQAIIQIVDKRKRGWGHINVDHILQSNAPSVSEKTRTIIAEKRYLNLPVKNGVNKKWMRLKRGDEILREFDIELATDDVDFWVVLDLTEFEGETLTLWADQVERKSKGFEMITQADAIIGGENLYQEKDRPQIHFSPARGWTNDPNGMMYYDGEYHLFFQHNPYGWNWGNMTWGHAVSKDLVHWEELGDAIHPDELGTIFSGGGVVDWNNTTGFQTGDEPPLICLFTYAGGANLSGKERGSKFTQGIAYSNDRGRTWTKYKENPVIGEIAGGTRDPKVIWHEPTQKWVMVLFIDKQELGFFTSSNLKSWERVSTLEPFYECPELFELPVDGDEDNKKWVVYGASGDYMIGEFDGKTFTPEGGKIKYQYGNCFYASQTFSDIPKEDGRRIQIAWGRVAFPGMPFNQMMDFPVVLTLHTTEEGIRMFANPVKEIELLHGKQTKLENELLNNTRKALAEGDLFHIIAEFDSVTEAEAMGITVRGLDIRYDTKKQELHCGDKVAPLKPTDGKLRLELVVDRRSVEIFGNKGRIYMPMKHTFNEAKRSIEVFSKGGMVKIQTLTVYELNSIWK